MHLFVWAEDSATELLAELTVALPDSRPEWWPPAFLSARFPVPLEKPLPHLAFARQWLPDARPLRGGSIRALAEQVCASLIAELPDGQPCSLHVVPRYGVRGRHHIGARAWHSARQAPHDRRSGARAMPAPGDLPPDTPLLRAANAGRNRAELVRTACLEILGRTRRQLLRVLRAEPAPFTPADSLAQCFLTVPDAAVVSVARAPLPFVQRHLLAPFPGGEIAPAADASAPSRAFAKLLEAEQRLGRRIETGERCVDLGAAPGSWTYVALQRGAHVTAVDRAGLRPDLARNPRLVYRSGDAFSFVPPRPVEWLLCDVIASPARSAELLLTWLRRGWCRNFIVTLKTGERDIAAPIARLKSELPALTSECFVTRLCANKKEVCAFGARRGS